MHHCTMFFIFIRMYFLFLLAVAEAGRISFGVRKVPTNELPVCAQLQKEADTWSIDRFLFGRDSETRQIKAQRFANFCFPWELYKFFLTLATPLTIALILLFVRGENKVSAFLIQLVVTLSGFFIGWFIIDGFGSWLMS